MILEFQKLHAKVKTPERGHPSDAGLDVFYHPSSGQEPYRMISPGESLLFGTGLKFGVPHGYMLEVKNRSSMAAKKSLLVGACVIDSGYDGEVFINLHNVGTTEQYISQDDKIAQLVMVPVVHFRALESLDKSLYSYPMTISDRGEGALGSTDG